MNKWYGTIGYAETVETQPGVWKEQITVRSYFGDVYKNNRRLQTTGESTNDSININNEISIIADPYAYENFHSMRYVEFMGTRWKISDVNVQYPRLILSIGGIYNGEQA